jgi:hypothetical protein
MKLILIPVLLFLTIQSTYASHKVYIIHGYGGSLLQMERINQRLIIEGYLTDNYSYHSFSRDLDSIGLDLCRKVKQENFDSVSFVTHSMGALVVRSMYQYIDSVDYFPFVFRIVELAPPNKGAKIADVFTGKYFKFLLGPNVEYMRTDSVSYANRLPVPDCETGIIAGVKGQKSQFQQFQNDDGKVSLQYTRQGNEKDFIVIQSWHDLMPFQKKVINLIISFLKTGSFQKN